MPELSKKVACHYPPAYKLDSIQIRRRRAEKRVNCGAARWMSPALDAIELTEQTVASEYADAWMWRQDQLNAERGYDKINRPMQPGELRGIPFVGQDLDRMFVHQSKTGNGTFPKRT